MFSPMKLLVLGAIIAVVWFAFKALARGKKAKASEAVDFDDNDNIEDKR